MDVRSNLVSIFGAAALAFSSCTAAEEVPVSSPPVEHPEVIEESGLTPLAVSNFALLVSDRDGLDWAWDWFRLGGSAPDLRSDVVFLLATTESGSCPIEYSGFEISGAKVEIQSHSDDGPCTADAHFRSIVLRLPRGDIPPGDLQVEIQGQEFPIRRLASNGRWLRHSILGWFEDVPETQLPERGVLGGTMSARVIAFPPDFKGTAGDDFFVLLEDGHIVSTYRYQVDSSLFWKSVDRERHGELPWKRLLTRKGFEVWEASQNGFAPYMRH